MTDIAARLSCKHELWEQEGACADGMCPLCMGAEIERLQGHMRALADTSVARDTAGIFKGLWQGSERECEELRAEIERLKADNKEMRGALIQVRARFQRLRLGPDEEQTLDRVNAALEPKP